MWSPTNTASSPVSTACGRVRRPHDLIVKNTRVYAGAWVLDRTSRHDDGAFELVPFRGKRDWASKAIVDLDGNPVTEEILNQVGIEHSHPYRASRIELTFDTPKASAPLAAQLDGEEWPAHPTSRSRSCLAGFASSFLLEVAKRTSPRDLSSRTRR